ncbi:MAG: CDP-diacylglycerol--glycerol-3-phosphate 3-phosphatidyltransferase [Desulfovibrio sp.]
MFTPANTLTMLRIGAVPFLVLLLYFPSKVVCLVAFFLFGLASVTDMLDGMIARRSGSVTALGKFLDPLADKLLICSVLIMLVHLEWIPTWLVIVIVSRELIVTGLRAIAAEQGKVIAADKLGKMKTVVQSMALGPLLLHYPVFGIDPVPLGMFLLYIALGLTVYSGGNYLYNFYNDVLAEG